LSGSSDIFQGSDRGPYASVNFVTCHDGFSLRDLVTYENKHNEANGEENRDGHGDNASRNWGVEGPSDSSQVTRHRERLLKNFFATLAFSQGVPMISHGDEIGRTQLGNNNAYCQDNETTWLDWKLDERAKDLLAFTRKVLALRAGNPVFRRRKFFAGNSPQTDGSVKDVRWLKPDGRELSDTEWANPRLRMLGMLIHGDASDELDERGRPNRGHTLLLWFNAAHRARNVTLPTMPEPGRWYEIVNTAQPTHRVPRGREATVAPHSLLLLSYDSDKD